ncbi:hypothetical protein TWF106_011393 [Orbilia oligospora]|uniref:Secreted protein n=1 Tax=Orbilia oligospora TaxID=2813651 RepID=A0A6G1LSJ8_ORBOL|nr:hypothetical protein TWF788_010291 [Orbilia oligospora]KAF3197974.1 hypothetical protein TWF679_002468 [Orbilia oligospora]KAF3199295.1 hypothetical protein TWF191_004446 [Orbilia oligospora]KAF3208496.1 hypothetical protein TWF106_011393 [Orbilia oligospora]KAF3230725.1 hypothetical protein TWF192_004360 [Orbilia oligospora]
MKFSATVIATSLLALVSAAPTTKADLPDPTKVWVQKIITGGTGCPAGTVSQQISNDRSTFTLIFDQYVASIGPGIPITESRKNCQLNVHLNYPAGWQYSVFSATYRGYAQLERGQFGTQKSTYYFSGDSHQTSTQTDFTGPFNRDYAFTDNVDQTSNVWSPCGREGLLNINSQVRLTGDNKKTGLLTTDSVDGKFTQILGFAWRRC